jgi:glycosyltransferase involved in cell wall biosynthesis
LKNPKLAKKMGENGRKLVEREYNWESVSKQIDNIYQGVIS